MDSRNRHGGEQKLAITGISGAALKEIRITIIRLSQTAVKVCGALPVEELLGF